VGVNIESENCFIRKIKENENLTVVCCNLMQSWAFTNHYFSLGIDLLVVCSVRLIRIAYSSSTEQVKY